MQWIGDSRVGRGVVERRFDLRCQGRYVPGIVWTPEGAEGPRPLVLLGHGGTLHKRAPYILALARRLVRHLGFAAAAIDGPTHGDRRKDGADDRDLIREDFQEALDRAETTDEMIEDWKTTLEALRAVPEIGSGPIGYWGLSMGTIYGLPFVAAEPRVAVAVLGLMGVLGPYGRRLAEDAANVTCPVLFLQQWDDELIPRDRVLTLFDSVGSSDKRLHAHPGKHEQVPMEEIEASEKFLAAHLKT
jgi:dienelactone hydrolase